MTTQNPTTTPPPIHPIDVGRETYLRHAAALDLFGPEQIAFWGDAA